MTGLRRRTGPGLRAGLLLLAVLGPGAAAAFAQENASPPGTSSGPVRTVVISVAGETAWTDTGLEVAGGDVIAFQAEGTITLQKGNPEAECGPDGYDLQTLQQPLTGRNLGALIGKVVIGVTVLVNEQTKEERQEESAVVFYVGSQGRLEMPAKGRLFLGINETVIGDNGGGFRVTVAAAPAR